MKVRNAGDSFDKSPFTDMKGNEIQPGDRFISPSPGGSYLEEKILIRYTNKGAYVTKPQANYSINSGYDFSQYRNADTHTKKMYVYCKTLRKNSTLIIEKNCKIPVL